MLQDIKQDLINKISATDDENLLLLLQTDYDFFTQANQEDAIDGLSENDRAELIKMVQEPFGSDTLSQPEFDEAIRQWRIK